VLCDNKRSPMIAATTVSCQTIYTCFFTSPYSHQKNTKCARVVAVAVMVIIDSTAIVLRISCALRRGNDSDHGKSTTLYVDAFQPFLTPLLFCYAKSYVILLFLSSAPFAHSTIPLGSVLEIALPIVPRPIRPYNRFN
jgi:hypothetical protein